MVTLPEGSRLNTHDNDYYLSSLDRLKDAMNRRIVLEARAIVCDCDHNLHVDLGIIRGVIPRTECATGIEEGYTKDIAILSRVNKAVCFFVTGFDKIQGRNVAMLSRRAVQEEFIKSSFSKLIPGDIVNARVTYLETFGAFCDIGCGVIALLPIDAISVSRIPHPSVRFSVGDDIRVIIKSFDERGRAMLSHKELLGTWEQNASLFKAGETVGGIIRSIEEYGIFVELTPNLAGLAEYIPNAAEGDRATVFIKSIIPEKMKFKLVIIDSFSADFAPSKPDYFYTGSHIDYFCYSPEICDRKSEIYFS